MVVCNTTCTTAQYGWPGSWYDLAHASWGQGYATKLVILAFVRGLLYPGGRPESIIKMEKCRQARLNLLILRKIKF